MYPVDINLAIARVLSRRKRLKRKLMDKIKVESCHALDSIAWQLGLVRFYCETDGELRQRILEL